MKRILFLVVLLGSAGCLPSSYQLPVKSKSVVTATSLGDKLATNFKAEMAAISQVARTLADSIEGDKPPQPADQQKAWAETDSIRAKFKVANEGLIEEAFKKTTNAKETSAVWREIARGYGV